MNLKNVRFFLAAGLMTLLSQVVDAAGDKDVSFFVVGKTPAYHQSAHGTLSHEKHYLFAEIFLKDGGNIKYGTLIPPKGSKYKKMVFEDAGHVWKIKRQDFAGLKELDAAFPDGDYQFIFETVNGESYKEKVSLRFPNNHRDFTDPISIYFYQGGRLVDQEAIDHNRDLLIGWSPFSNGSQDPRGIADDLIFAISSDCHGEPFARSALPFVAIPALSYNDNQFRIPADRLQPGSSYRLIVEHAQLVDTIKSRSGVIGLATYPGVTNTVFTTTGPANLNCPKR